METKRTEITIVSEVADTNECVEGNISLEKRRRGKTAGRYRRRWGGLAFLSMSCTSCLSSCLLQSCPMDSTANFSLTTTADQRKRVQRILYSVAGSVDHSRLVNSQGRKQQVRHVFFELLLFFFLFLIISRRFV